MGKKIKKLVVVTGLVMIGLIGNTNKTPFGMTAYASEVQTKQLSPRWYADANGTWYLRNEAGTGNVVNAWFEDGGDWYLLAQGDGHMYSGLVHDTITNKWYMMNTVHDGTYGRMFVTDGSYNVNGVEVYLTFNQSHDGTYGAITSGLEALRNTGVYTEEISGITTENAGNEATAASVNDNKVGNNVDLGGLLDPSTYTEEQIRDGSGYTGNMNTHWY